MEINNISEVITSPSSSPVVSVIPPESHSEFPYCSNTLTLDDEGILKTLSLNTRRRGSTDVSSTPPPLTNPKLDERDKKTKSEDSAAIIMKMVGTKNNNRRRNELKQCRRQSRSNNGRDFGPHRHFLNPNIEEGEATLKAYQRSQFFKTRMCPHFIKSGMCRRGQQCNYAHDESELQPSVNLTKTKLCKNFVVGICEKVDTECEFAHGLDCLRSTSGFYKTQLCKFWLAGHCPAGPLCRHAHGDDEWPTALQMRLAERRKTDFGEFPSLRRASATPISSRCDSINPMVKMRQQRFSVCNPTTPFMGVVGNPCSGRDSESFATLKSQEHQSRCNFIVSPTVSTELPVPQSINGDASHDTTSHSRIDKAHQSPRELAIENGFAEKNEKERVRVTSSNSDEFAPQKWAVEPFQMGSNSTSMPFIYAQGYSGSSSYSAFSTPSTYPATASPPYTAVAITPTFATGASQSMQVPSHMVQPQTPGFYFIPAISVLHSVPPSAGSLMSVGNHSPQQSSTAESNKSQGSDSTDHLGIDQSNISSQNITTPQTSGGSPMTFCATPSYPAICALTSTYPNSQNVPPPHTNGRRMSANDAYLIPQVASPNSTAITRSAPVMDVNSSQARRASDFYQIVTMDNSPIAQRRGSDLYQVLNPHTVVPLTRQGTMNVSCCYYGAPIKPTMGSNISTTEGSPQSSKTGGGNSPLEGSGNCDVRILESPTYPNGIPLPLMPVNELSKPENLNVRYED